MGSWQQERTCLAKVATFSTVAMMMIIMVINDDDDDDDGGDDKNLQLDEQVHGWVE